MKAEAATAIATLAASPGPAGAVLRAAGGVLVLDASGERPIAASGGATALASALTAEASGLASQLRRIASNLSPEGRPRLERLRLNRLAPALTCTCLRADLPGAGPVIVIALPGAPRPGHEPPEHAAEAHAPPSAAAPEPPRSTLRFLWRSDAEGRLFEVSSVLADRVRGGVVGRTWSELCADGVVDETGDLVEALSARATFRGLAVRWRVGGGPRRLAVELSATPRRGPDGAFAGYDGFGLVEAVPIEPAPSISPDPILPDPASSDPGPTGAAAPGEAPAPAPVAEPALPEYLPPVAEPHPPKPTTLPAPAPEFPALASLAEVAMTGLTEIMTAPFGFGWHAAAVLRPSVPAAGTLPAAGAVAAESPALVALPAPEEAPGVDPVPAPSEAPPASAAPAGDDGLSLSEHHAFREIARALGARFAGDEGGGETTSGPTSASATLLPFARVAREDDAEGDLLAGTDLPGTDGGSRADAADTRRLLDRLPIGTLVHRGETALYANRAFLETVGYADVPELQEDGGVARLFRGGPSGGRRSLDAAAVGVSTKSGATVPVEVRIATVPWGRDPAGLMLVRRLPDVDPVQRAAALELELAAARARLAELAAILDATGDAVVTADARLRLTSLNRQAEALFGYAAREVAGEPLSLLVAAESHPALHGLVEAARAGPVPGSGPASGTGLASGAGPASGSAASGALTGRGRHGAALHLEARLARLPGEVPAGAFCAVLTDASASHAAAKRLAAAEAAARAAGDRAGAFLERAGQEIRTPLNAILGFAELMLEERFGPIGGERYRGYLRDVHASGTRLVDRVGALLDLARLEAGRRPMASDVLDLGAVAAACVTDLQVQASRARIVVRTSFAPGLPRVRADAAALRGIADHLVANAIQFTEAGGQVIVSTGPAEGGAVVLRVRDTGIGMTRDEVAAALDAFRSDRPAAGEPVAATGGGLGLPLARALAAANGAALTVQSTKGEGTLVELLVPAERVVAG